MAVDDFLEPEVGVAVAITAALASPKVRGLLRRGAVYGLAGALVAGDAAVALANGIKRGITARTAAAPAAVETGESATPIALSSEVTEPAPEKAVAPKSKSPRAKAASANGEDTNE